MKQHGTEQHANQIFSHSNIQSMFFHLLLYLEIDNLQIVRHVKNDLQPKFKKINNAII